jgi:predicted AAA+ superfamily ATPase
MAQYRRRIIDAELDEVFPALAAISIDGPKGVGKTATATQRAATTVDLDIPSRAEELSADPGFLDRARKPLLIDEWQRLPHVWDLVRRAVDRDRTGGQFLLAGSAAPVTTPTHSGAGRITSLRMRPLAVAERVDAPPTVSIAALFAGDSDIGGETGWALPDYVREIVSSGFPGIRELPARARRLALDGYLARVVERDMVEQGYRVRTPAALRSWLRAYASATASTASYTTILDAATIGDADKPSKPTTIAYRDVLSQLWLLDPVEAWLPFGTDLGRIAKAPKHHLADPALAARLMDIDEQSLLELRDHAMIGPQQGAALGRLFEGLVTLSMQTYAQSAEARLRHFRDQAGSREIDLILESRGRVVAAEVKLAATVDHADVRHLLWLRSRLGSSLADAIVVTTGERAYRRPDGIAVVPLALLGP